LHSSESSPLAYWLLDGLIVSHWLGLANYGSGVGTTVEQRSRLGFV